MIIAGNNKGKSIEEIQREQERVRVSKYISMCVTLEELERVRDIVEELGLIEQYKAREGSLVEAD